MNCVAKAGEDGNGRIGGRSSRREEEVKSRQKWGSKWAKRTEKWGKSEGIERRRIRKKVSR